MAGNVQVNQPISSGAIIASEDVGGVQHQKVIAEFSDGAGGVTMVSASNPLPVLAAIDTTGLATSANQGTEIVALASILAKIIASPSTEAKQDALNALVTTLNSIVATAAKQDTGNTSLGSIDTKISTLLTQTDGIETSLSTIDGKTPVLGQAAMAASSPVVIASNQSAVPVSAAALPLPSGAATEAKQDTGNTSLGSVDTKMSTLLLQTDAVEALLTNIDAGTAAGLGQTTMAASVPVAIASNQSALPVTISGATTDNVSLYSNSIVSAGAITGIDTTGYQILVIQLTGIWVGSLLAEGSNDNTNWVELLITPVGEMLQDDVFNCNGVYTIKTTAKYFRLNVLQLASGSITALILGRTVEGTSAVDRLSFAMDKNNNQPIYVSDLDTKKDISKALIPSDAPAPIYGQAGTLNAELFRVDTTGYQSIVVQTITFGSILTMQTSNDGTNWASLLGYNPAVTSPTSSIAANGTWDFPVIGKFARCIMGGSIFTSVVCYLRQKPANPFNLGFGGAVSLTAINGTTPVTAGVGGVLAIGGRDAVAAAPTTNPLVTGAIDTAGVVRRILSDTSGRILSDNMGIDQTGTVRQVGVLALGSNNANLTAQAVIDVSTQEGKTTLDFLSQILLELRISNQYAYELPKVLQRVMNDTMKDVIGHGNEPVEYRNEQSLFVE